MNGLPSDRWETTSTAFSGSGPAMDMSIRRSS